MPLSANTVFHFTEKKEDLEGILEHDFKVYYCKEQLYIGRNPMVFRAPMVSFCDIPLSEIKPHIKSYGPYGIGLSKEWAVRSKLNPVIYMEKNSFLSASLIKFLSHYTELIDQRDEASTEAKRAPFDIFRYMKNYQGDLVRRDRDTIKDYRFSDEREWRYVPEFTKAFPMMLIQPYHDHHLVNAEKAIQSESLVFTPNDIKYLIIKDDSEINEFVKFLKYAKWKYDEKDVERLTTRILTSKQIHEDI